MHHTQQYIRAETRGVIIFRVKADDDEQSKSK